MSILDYYFQKGYYSVESKEGYSEIVINIPGYSKKDVSIKIKEHKNYLYVSTKDGKCDLPFYMSNVIDIIKVSAELKYGQLTIKLPYKEEYLKEINVSIS